MEWRLSLGTPPEIRPVSAATTRDGSSSTFSGCLEAAAMDGLQRFQMRGEVT